MKKEKPVVAYAKFKERDVNGNFRYLENTRRFPIRAAKKQLRDLAINSFINRTVRKGQYYRHDIWCFIEDTEGRQLRMLKGGHDYRPGYKSLYRMVHLDCGEVVQTLFSTPDMDSDPETAPWTLVNLYRPQRKNGFVAVYDNRSNRIVIRNQKPLRWQNGKRAEASPNNQRHETY